ncbi:MAG: hypothetical protein K8R40_11050 [Anaerolineaceae bacterium]|nr:hypothetical protein [Anaerolineaceae bacterium]
MMNEILWPVIFLLLVISPFAAVILLRGRRSIKNAVRIKRIAWISIAFLSFLMLLAQKEIAFHLKNPMFPAEMMGIQYSRSGMQTLFLLAISAFLISFIKIPDENYGFSKLSFILFGIAIFVFTATDLFIRLLALELAAILISIFAFSASIPISKRWYRFFEIYLPMRIAGFGMLALILILFQSSNTFNITNVLENSSARNTGFSWLLIAAWLVVWIKTATFPFKNWLITPHHSHSTDWFFSAELITTGFGYYLLYRLHSLLPQAPLVYSIIAFVAIGLEIGFTFSKHGKDTRFSYLQMSLLPACLILMATGHGNWILLLFLISIPLKTISFTLSQMQISRAIKPITSAVYALLPVGFILASLLNPLQDDPFPKIFSILTLITAIIAPFLYYQHRKHIRDESPPPESNSHKIIQKTALTITNLFKTIDSLLVNIPRSASQSLQYLSTIVDSFHDGNLKKYLRLTILLTLVVLLYVIVI